MFRDYLHKIMSFLFHPNQINKMLAFWMIEMLIFVCDLDNDNQLEFANSNFSTQLGLEFYNYREYVIFHHTNTCLISN